MWFSKSSIRNIQVLSQILIRRKKLVTRRSTDIIILRRNNIRIYCFDYRLTRFSTKNAQKVSLWQREQGKGTRNTSPTSLTSVPGRFLSLYVNLCHRKRKRERIEIGEAREREGGRVTERGKKKNEIRVALRSGWHGLTWQRRNDPRKKEALRAQ